MKQAKGQLDGTKTLKGCRRMLHACMRIDWLRHLTNDVAPNYCLFSRAVELAYLDAEPLLFSLAKSPLLISVLTPSAD